MCLVGCRERQYMSHIDYGLDTSAVFEFVEFWMLPENSCQSHNCNQLQNIKSDFEILIKTHPTTTNNELSTAHKTSTSSSISVLLKKFLRMKLITAFFSLFPLITKHDEREKKTSLRYWIFLLPLCSLLLFTATRTWHGRAAATIWCVYIL